MLLKLPIMLLSNVSTFPSTITFGCAPFVRWWWQSSSRLLDSTMVNYFTCDGHKQSSQLEKPYSTIFFMSLHHIHSKYSLLIVTYTVCYTNYVKLLHQSMTSSGRGWGAPSSLIQALTLSLPHPAACCLGHRAFSLVALLLNS